MSRFFIDRPVFAWVVAIFIMLGGLLSLYRLPVEQYPNVGAPTININVAYPGASATTIEESVLSVIEREKNGIDGLGYHLELTPEAKDYVTTKGYDVQFGARPLKRAIQKYIEDELAEIVLLEDIQPGDTITLGYDAATDRMTHTVLRPAVDEAPPVE